MATASYISLTAFSDRGLATHSNGIGSLRTQRLIHINSVSPLTLWTHRRRVLLYLASGIIGRPSLSTGGRMSNVARMHAIVRHSIRCAKWRPGQILLEGFKRLINTILDPSYLRPEPKTLASGSLTEGSILPSLSRNRAGLYVCGS